MYHTSIIGFNVVMLLLLAACDDGAGPSIHITDAGKDALISVDQRGRVDTCVPACEGRVCGDDGCSGSCGDCASDRVCSDDGQCATVPCINSKDCLDTLVCDEEEGVCTECVGDEDCPDGGVCNDAHHCMEDHHCQSDLDCNDFDQLCDKEIGLCVDCLDAEDCPEEEFCDAGICLPDVCAAGGTGCDGQDATLCEQDGSGWTVTETCGQGWYCDAGACLGYACEAGASWCEESMFKACSDDGKELLEETDCAATGLYCTPEGCLETICPPGQVYCQDDETLATCSEGGMELSTEPCEDGHYCEDGACVPQVCEPFAPICEGNVATVCNAKGSGPMIGGTVCAPGEQVCTDGVCVDCEVDCSEKECGDDGCGGFCGICLDEICTEGTCVECWDGNQEPWDGCNDGVTVEWTVNETIIGKQERPAVAIVPSGQFLVVWQSGNGAWPGNGWDVFARIFDEGGTPIGSEFQVNSAEDGLQMKPEVVGMTDGRFLVVWSSYEGGNEGYSIHGRFVGTDGGLQPEFVVSATPGTGFDGLGVATWDDGRFVVTWSQPTAQTGSSIYVQLFGSDEMTAGPETVVVTESGGSKPTNPAITTLGDGGFVIGWKTPSAVTAQRFNENGIEIPDSLVGIPDAQWPDISICNTNNEERVVLAWKSLSGGFGENEIVLRIMDLFLSPLVEDIVTNDQEPGISKGGYPTVCSSGGTSIYIAWQESSSQGFATNVWLSAFDAVDGAALFGPFQLGAVPDAIPSLPAIAAWPDGRTIVVWQASDMDGSETGVFAVCRDSEGAAVSNN